MNSVSELHCSLKQCNSAVNGGTMYLDCLTICNQKVISYVFEETRTLTVSETLVLRDRTCNLSSSQQQDYYVPR